jgi:hypothetical protein
VNQDIFAYFFKYANIYICIFEKIFISQKMCGGLAYIYIYAIYFTFTQKKNLLGWRGGVDYISWDIVECYGVF